MLEREEEGRIQLQCQSSLSPPSVELKVAAEGKKRKCENRDRPFTNHDSKHDGNTGGGGYRLP